MTTHAKRRPRLANGTRVHVRSDHFAEECDAVIRKAIWDDGWLYRIDVVAGDAPEVIRNKAGELWVWDFEVRPLAA